VQKNVEGSFFEFDVTTQFNSRQFDMADFVIVAFQTGRSKDQTKEASNFDHCKVKNIYVKNGRNEVFPKENRRLDIAENDYFKMYEDYTAFKRITCGNSEMYYSPDEFINNRPMYVINCREERVCL